MPTYAVQAADYGKQLRVRSRATNAEGTTDAYSDATDPIASPTDPKGDYDNDGLTNDVDPDRTTTACPTTVTPTR